MSSSGADTTHSTPPTPVRFRGAHPIGGDPMALPVKDIGPAIGYYVHVLGFEVVDRTDTAATLRRSDATIGLAVNDEDPEQVSVYFDVTDVEALRAEYAARGIAPSELRVDEHGGGRYRVFFAKEPYGVCFCFGQPAA